MSIHITNLEFDGIKLTPTDKNDVFDVSIDISDFLDPYTTKMESTDSEVNEIIGHNLKLFHPMSIKQIHIDLPNHILIDKIQQLYTPHNYFMATDTKPSTNGTVSISNGILAIDTCTSQHVMHILQQKYKSNEKCYRDILFKRICNICTKRNITEMIQKVCIHNIIHFRKCEKIVFKHNFTLDIVQSMPKKIKSVYDYGFDNIKELYNHNNIVIKKKDTLKHFSLLHKKAPTDKCSTNFNAHKLVFNSELFGDASVKIKQMFVDQICKTYSTMKLFIKHNAIYNETTDPFNIQNEYELLTKFVQNINPNNISKNTKLMLFFCYNLEYCIVFDLLEKYKTHLTTMRELLQQHPYLVVSDKIGWTDPEDTSIIDVDESPKNDYSCFKTIYRIRSCNHFLEQTKNNTTQLYNCDHYIIALNNQNKYSIFGESVSQNKLDIKPHLYRH